MSQRRSRKLGVCLGLIVWASGLSTIPAQQITGADALQQKMRQLESGREAVAWANTLSVTQREQAAGILVDLLGGVLSDRRTQPKRAVGVYVENVMAAYAAVADHESLRAMAGRLLSADDGAMGSRVVSGLAKCGSAEALAMLGDWARPLIEKLSPIIPDPVTESKELKKLDDHLQPLAVAIFELSQNASPEGWKLRTECLTALIAKYEKSNHGKNAVARLKEELAKTPTDAVAQPEEQPEQVKGEANILRVHDALLVPRTDAQLSQMELADLKALTRHANMDRSKPYPMLAFHEITRRKDPEGLDFMVALALKAEKNLPDIMPSMEELEKVQQRREHGPLERCLVDLSSVALSLLYLTQSALPAGPQGADKIMVEFKRRWGASDTGRIMMGLLEQQMDWGRQMIQRGQAPWQGGRNEILGEGE